MKRKTFLLLFCILLLCGAAVAEEQETAGSWTVVSVVSLDKPEMTERMPSQWGLDFPVITFAEDGSCLFQFGTEQETGFWRPDESSGTIHLYQEPDKDELVLVRSGDKLTAGSSLPSIGSVDVVFARLEPDGPAGSWTPVMQTYGNGEYWLSFPGAEQLEIHEDGTGVLKEKDISDKPSEIKCRWQRKGNDIVISVPVIMEDGTEKYYPYRFYQLEKGMLKRLSAQDSGNAPWLYFGREDSRPGIEPIENILPLLNTAWELAAIDVAGVRVPVSVIGTETEEYLTFLMKGSGSLIRVDGKEKSTVRYTCGLKDGTINLFVAGQDPIPCGYADGTYLTRTLSTGQVMYYQRKLIANAVGIGEDNPAPMDLTIVVPDNATVQAGESLQLLAEFADPKTVNSEKGNNDLSWAVCDLSGNEVFGVSIDPDGKLSVDQAMKDPAEVKVTVSSVQYGTEAECMITVNP